MLDLIIYILVKYTYVVATFFFVVKIILFFRHKNKNWTFLEFLYFNEVNIKFTSKAERVRHKRQQNLLSIIILTLLIVQLVAILLFSPV